jgi:flagellar biosynthesis chaperone FliJ
MSDKDANERQLHTLERWQRLELEAAQVEHLARRAVEQEKQHERDRVLQAVESTQSFTRDKCDRGATLSPQTLLLAARYSQTQQQQLAEAERSLTQSRAAVEEAHGQVVSRSEHLFGIEKLRDRRRERRSQDEARQEQNRLDEGALVKLSNESVKENRKL